MKKTLKTILSAVVGVALVIGIAGQYAYYKLSNDGGFSHYGVTEVTKVLNKVIKNNIKLMTPRENTEIKVLVSSDLYFNAFIFESEDEKTGKITIYITVTQGLLNFIESEDQLALVLGHEWGHHLNGDIRGKWVPKESERVADMSGAWMASQAGYDACHGKQMWGKIKEVAGNDGHSLSHPNYSQRMKTLQCSLKTTTKVRLFWVDTNKFVEYYVDRAVSYFTGKNK